MIVLCTLEQHRIAAFLSSALPPFFARIRGSGRGSPSRLNQQQAGSKNKNLS
jgi:hypothetical protein